MICFFIFVLFQIHMQTPINASQIFTFLRRNYRVSRNTRALWQFQQIVASPSNRVRIPTSDEIVRYQTNI
jgi:hypothetical protein